MISFADGSVTDDQSTEENEIHNQKIIGYDRHMLHHPRHKCLGTSIQKWGGRREAEEEKRIT
jgi:hypothetical protein